MQHEKKHEKRRHLHVAEHEDIGEEEEKIWRKQNTRATQGVSRTTQITQGERRVHIRLTLNISETLALSSDD